MTVCHFLLCITSAWALKRINAPTRSIATGCFLFLFGHSVLGILYRQSRRVRRNRSIEISTCAAETLPHPLINAQLYTMLGREEIGYIHILMGIIPVNFKLFNGNVDNEIINLFQILNIISSIYLAIQKDNGWCCLMAVNQLIFNRPFHHFDEDKLCWIASGLSLFTIIAVKSIESLR